MNGAGDRVPSHDSTYVGSGKPSQGQPATGQSPGSCDRPPDAEREDARCHAPGRTARTPLMFILWNRLKHAEVAVYFTDRGIEELDERRGGDQVTLGWLAARLQAFVDLHPDFDVPVDRLATWLARADDEDGEP